MASDIKKTVPIYIQLLDEGTDVWRPTQALDVGNGSFRVLPTPDYDPEDEIWEFLPGSLVRLGKKRISVGEVLIAIEQIG